MEHRDQTESYVSEHNGQPLLLIAMGTFPATWAYLNAGTEHRSQLLAQHILHVSVCPKRK